MFGTMGDLISEASDSKDWRSYVKLTQKNNKQSFYVLILHM